MNWKKKLAERWLAKIDQQSWFRRMLCWQIFTGTLLLVQLRSLHFQGIKNRPVYLRSFAHSWIPSFPTALKASPFLHLHLQVFILAVLNREEEKTFPPKSILTWSGSFSHFGKRFFSHFGQRFFLSHLKFTCVFFPRCRKEVPPLKRWIKGSPF